MNRKISFSEVERYIKKSIKGKLKFSRALVISFLISGCLSSVVYGANIWIDNSIVEKKAILVGIQLFGMMVFKVTIEILTHMKQYY